MKEYKYWYYCLCLLLAVTICSSSTAFQSNILLNHLDIGIVDLNGVTLLNSHYGVHQSGVVSLYSTVDIEQTFQLRNSGNIPLTDLHLQYPKGSLRVFVNSSDSANLALSPIKTGSILPTLFPGRDLTVRVLIDLTYLAPGPFSRAVMILTPNNIKPIITLEMRGTLGPSITFLPNLIDFGSTPAGKTVTRNLTVRIDPRLVPSGAVPKLFCSNPEIIIDSIPVEEYAQSKSRLLTPQQQSAGLFSYRLTLPSTAPLGQVSGNLFIPYIEPSTRAGVSSIPPDMQLRITRALKSASAVLTGQVVGDLSVAPLSVDLGTVAAGKDATRQIVLTGKTASTFKNVQISSSSQRLSARWIVPNTPSPAIVTIGRPMQQTLEVILANNTPPGAFNSQLTLTLANGQHVVVPVTAIVTSNAD